MARQTTEQRRQQLIEAALTLLADNTLSALSTRTVARHLGLSQPALFRHFRSRDALMVAVVDHARTQLGTVAQALLEEPADGLVRLERLAVALAGYVQENPGMPRLLFSDGSADSEPLRMALSQLLSMQRSLVAELVRQGQREGLLDRRVAPQRAGLLYVGMVQALVLQWQLAGRQDDLSAEIRPLLRLWLEGVQSRGDSTTDAPAEVDEAVQDGISQLDVRPILAGGRDPLDDVLAAVARLRPGAALLLTVPFRPAPLITLLGGHGHSVHARILDNGACCVAVVARSTQDVAELIDLEPPEPLEATLVATAALEPGASWLGWLPRYPRMLMPLLDKRGLAWTVAEALDGRALLHVRRPA